jgi:hypothetical protein
MLKSVLDEFQEIKVQRKLIHDKNISLLQDLKNDIISIKSLLNNQSINKSEDEMINLNLNETTNSVENKISNITTIINNIEKKAFVANFNNNTNNLYNTVSKFSKTLSVFEKDDLEPPKLLPYEKNIFLKIICQDLYRKGNFQTADSLIIESKVNVDDNLKHLFQDLQLITKELKEYNIEPLNNWCIKHKDELNKIDSDLPFSITKYKFFEILYDENLSQFDVINKCKFIFKELLSQTKYVNKISELMSLVLIRKVGISKNSKEHKLKNEVENKNQASKLSFNTKFVETHNINDLKLVSLMNINTNIKFNRDKDSRSNEEFCDSQASQLENNSLNDIIKGIITSFTKDCCSILSKFLLLFRIII